MTAPGPVAVLIATQNLNAVLRIMQWGVIALIFLFFLRGFKHLGYEILGSLDNQFGRLRAASRCRGVAAPL